MQMGGAYTMEVWMLYHKLKLVQIVNHFIYVAKHIYQVSYYWVTLELEYI